MYAIYKKAFDGEFKFIEYCPTEEEAKRKAKELTDLADNARAAYPYFTSEPYYRYIYKEIEPKAIDTAEDEFIYMIGIHIPYEELTPEGFCKTEEEAKEVVEKMEEKYGWRYKYIKLKRLTPKKISEIFVIAEVGSKTNKIIGYCDLLEKAESIIKEMHEYPLRNNIKGYEYHKISLNTAVLEVKTKYRNLNDFDLYDDKFADIKLSLEN